MSQAYVIVGPLPVNGKRAGETVLRDDLTDPDFLLAIGYITPVDKTSAKKAENDRGDLVESTSESRVDSDPTDTQQETR